MRMQLTDPVTALTDYALAIAGLVFAFLMGRSLGPANRVAGWFWCGAFAAAAVAAALGGTFHGFATALGLATRRVLWNTTMFSMGVCGAMIAAGVHVAAIRRGEGTVMWLVLGTLTTVLGAAPQLGSVGARLNAGALYHTIQIVGLYFFYRCARTVQDRPGIRTNRLPA
jgi:hypothetical protein